MNIARLFLTASLATASLSSYGTVYFQNTGVISGWDSATPQSGTKGKVAAVSSPTYKTSSAILTEQDWNGVLSGHHSEVVKAQSQKNGQDRYYGQAIFLPSNWVFHDANDTFQQFSPEDPAGPWNLNWIQNNHLFIRVAGTHYDLGPISKGVWTRVVVRFKLGNPGTFQYWVNGVKKAEATNINLTIPNGSPTIRWSCGIYCTSWRTTPPPAGDATVRQIYHDQFRIASTLAEADPANW
jgi:hypothetical protein